MWAEGRNCVANLLLYSIFLFLDVERIATFSARFGLPAIYRTHVWKVILGEGFWVKWNTLFLCTSHRCQNKKRGWGCWSWNHAVFFWNSTLLQYILYPILHPLLASFGLVGILQFQLCHFLSICMYLKNPLKNLVRSTISDQKLISIVDVWHKKLIEFVNKL